MRSRDIIVGAAGGTRLGSLSIIIVQDSTDTTISSHSLPPDKAIFFSKRVVAARYEEGCYEKDIYHALMFAKDYRPMTSGWQGAPKFQEIRPWAGFKTDDFVKEKLGGLP